MYPEELLCRYTQQQAELLVVQAKAEAVRSEAEEAAAVRQRGRSCSWAASEPTQLLLPTEGDSSFY